MTNSIFKGSKLAGGNFRCLTQGAYGVIFIDDNAQPKRIRKVAYRSPDKNDEHCRKVFQAEFKAIKKAEASQCLRKLVATPFSRIDKVTVLGNQCQDISEKFFTDMVFEADYIPGLPLKIGKACPKERSRIQNLFRKEGICHTNDACVFLNEQNQIIKVIDFATHEVELCHQPIC
jgi:hypothetical protein